jgi:aminoglycoside/choline kinase family phosphotransferase
MHTCVTQHSDPACPAFKLAFDVPKLLSELQFFREHAIEGLWQQTLTSTARDDLDAAFEPLCALLASAPRYFCHRDYHGWNIMAYDGAVGVLDFQDARLGPQPYDLASLLTDRGTPDLLGSALMTGLMHYYTQCMEAELGRRIDRDAFDQLFDYVAIQRCVGNGHICRHGRGTASSTVSAVYSSTACLSSATAAALPCLATARQALAALRAPLTAMRCTCRDQAVGP